MNTLKKLLAMAPVVESLESADAPCCIGEESVDRAIQFVAHALDGSGLRDVSLFLKRIARAESNYGKHPATFRRDYHGGIWQVDSSGFKETQNTRSHPSLPKLYSIITKNIGDQCTRHEALNWRTVQWEGLRTNEYWCALAARLLLACKAEAIPPDQDLAGQARYWKKHYNTDAGAGTVEHFMRVNSSVNQVPPKEDVISHSHYHFPRRGS